MIAVAKEEEHTPFKCHPQITELTKTASAHTLPERTPWNAPPGAVYLSNRESFRPDQLSHPTEGKVQEKRHKEDML